MRNEILGMILTKLATMDGKYWPALRDGDDELDPDRASYAEVLIDLPDSAGAGILRGILTHFDSRPTHKALREWGVSLAPPPPFKIEQICAPPSGQARLTGPASGVESYALRCLPPAAAKGVIERLRQRPADPENSQEWGLQFRDRASGRISRTQPSYSRAGADRKAQERNEKWAHVETTVYHKGDPMPEQPAPRPAAESGAVSEREMQAA